MHADFMHLRNTARTLRLRNIQYSTEGPTPSRWPGLAPECRSGLGARKGMLVSGVGRPVGPELRQQETNRAAFLRELSPKGLAVNQEIL